jgi:tetratricopeptide (TPR) repeat protein
MKILLWLLVFTLAARADFDAANRAFEAGYFREAKNGYLALVERGEWSANLFYNLGNTEARLGDVGRAMLNYERALALEPRHAEARANWQFLRSQSLAKFPPKTWREALFGALSFDGWLGVAVGSAWALLFCLAVPYARRQRLTAGGVFLFVLALCVGGCALAGAWLRAPELDAAIVVAKQAEARQAPADRATLVDVLPAGSRVCWRAERSGWVECDLPDGTRGWLPLTAVEKVRL